MKIIYSLGIDFGTNSVRALILDLANGTEVSCAVHPYPSGMQGILLDDHNHHLARQNPADYLLSMEQAVKKAVQAAVKNGVDIIQIKGIGIDATGSTPLPVDQKLVPLAFQERFKNNPNAQAWLWKDHTATEEAAEITGLAKKIRPEYLKKCGGSYSSEWFFSKIYRCFHVDREVFDAAYSWMELSDYIPAVLSGADDLSKAKRNICAAGHKAMYNDSWGGLPDKDFLDQLSPELAKLRDCLYNKTFTFEEIAGNLSKEWADKFGLPAGIPIAAGALDAHVGAIGSGVGKNTMVKVIGTSTCDIMVFPENEKVNDIAGVSGVVRGSVLPGYIGVEAGQSAVGDIFNWFVQKVLKKEEEHQQELSIRSQKLKAGESGLLALDWNNGNRNVLADADLTGLLIGQTINTADHEIYRALIEATAFGSLAIIERIESYGIKIDKVINCGGISQKNPMLMQIYANVLNRPMEIADSEQTVAVGAAMMGAYAALKGQPGFENIETIQKRICRVKEIKYYPEAGEQKVYRSLYVLYKKLHDAFGLPDNKIDLYSVMKDLLKIKSEVSRKH